MLNVHTRKESYVKICGYSFNFNKQNSMGRKLRVKYKKPTMLSVKAFVFNPVEENTYLLYNDEKECCIIDPGCYFSEEREELKNYIEKEGLKPALLLNTHCHLDHV